MGVRHTPKEVKCMNCGKTCFTLAQKWKYCEECRPLMRRKRLDERLQREQVARGFNYITHVDSKFDKKYREIHETGLSYAEYQKRKTFEMIERQKKDEQH